MFPLILFPLLKWTPSSHPLGNALDQVLLKLTTALFSTLSVNGTFVIKTCDLELQRRVFELDRLGSEIWFQY